MSEPEQRVAHALANTAQPPDEQFVSSVMQRIAATERRRVLVLASLTLVAAALAGVFAYGLLLSTSVWTTLAAGLPANLAVAVDLPVLVGCVLAGVVLLSLLARALDDGF